MATYNVDWNYDARKIRKYIRTGSCNSCGDCCTAYIKLDARSRWDNDGRNGGEHTNKKGVWHEIIRRPDRRIFYRIIDIIPNGASCGSFDFPGCGCNGNKPKICKYWPITPFCQHLFPNCGFQFSLIREWDMDIEVEENIDFET